jgi:hypothetical protein
MQQSIASSRYFFDLNTEKPTKNWKGDVTWQVFSEGASNYENTSTEGGNKMQEDLRLTNKNMWKIQICVLGSEKSGRTSLL